MSLVSYGIISSDKAGFIQPSEERGKTTRTLNVIEKVKKTTLYTPSTDSERIFDRVHWDFLSETLKCVGMPTPV